MWFCHPASVSRALGRAATDKDSPVNGTSESVRPAAAGPPATPSGCATAITAPAAWGFGIRLALRACVLFTVPTDCWPCGNPDFLSGLGADLGGHVSLLEQSVTVSLQHPADQLAVPRRATTNDFFRQNVDLPPAQPLKRTNGSAENHRFDSSPQRRCLAHGTRLSGRVQDETLPFDANT